MPRRGRGGSWRRVVLPMMVAAIQLAATVWVPMMHAGTVVLNTAPAVEAHHSGDCSEFHVETRCTTCAASREVPAAPPRHLSTGAGCSLKAPQDTSELGLARKAFSPSNSPRAPPSF